MHVGRSNVVDCHAGGGLATTAIFVGDRDGNGVTAVVKVVMRDAAEAQDARAEVKRSVGATIAPVDDDGVRIQRTGIGERTAQRGRVVLVHAGGAEAQLHVGRRDVVDRDADGGLAAATVFVGDRDGGRVIARLEVLVAWAAEAQGAGRQVKWRVGAAVAPVNDDGVRVQGARIAEAAAERG